MNSNKKQQFKELVQSNIKQYGFHITIVGSEVLPRYAYTIGLTELLGFELAFAGGVLYLKEEVLIILNEIAEGLKKGNDKHLEEISVGALGTFSFLQVDPSWNKLVLLGVIDHYKTNDIKALQVIPDIRHYTLDIPDMSKDLNVYSDPVWQWLVRKWDYDVPENSTVTTNINTLQGEAVTEVMRWEENEWEMFAGAGPEVPKEDMRVVPLGTMLGIDKMLLPAIKLKIGKGLWREGVGLQWSDWG